MTLDAFILDGRAYSWKALREMRRTQLEAMRTARGSQPALFELHEDRRPESQRCAAGRYAEPLLLEVTARPPWVLAHACINSRGVRCRTNNQSENNKVFALDAA
jgi:hypothetical protein